MLHIAQGTLANAQAAKQFVGLQQLGPQHLGQFATGQAPHDLHLEQAVLGMHIAQGAVQVGFVFGADMRYATVVVAHRDRALQVRQRHRALARGLFAVDVPTDAQGDQHNQHRKNLQDALHEHSLPKWTDYRSLGHEQ